MRKGCQSTSQMGSTEFSRPRPFVTSANAHVVARMKRSEIRVTALLAFQFADQIGEPGIHGRELRQTFSVGQRRRAVALRVGEIQRR